MIMLKIQKIFDERNVLIVGGIYQQIQLKNAKNSAELLMTSEFQYFIPVCQVHAKHKFYKDKCGSPIANYNGSYLPGTKFIVKTFRNKRQPERLDYRLVKTFKHYYKLCEYDNRIIWKNFKNNFMKPGE